MSGESRFLTRGSAADASEKLHTVRDKFFLRHEHGLELKLAGVGMILGTLCGMLSTVFMLGSLPGKGKEQVMGESAHAASRLDREIG